MEWYDMAVVNTLSKQKLIPPSVITCNPFVIRKLNRILQSPFCAYVVFKHNSVMEMAKFEQIDDTSPSVNANAPVLYPELPE